MKVPERFHRALLDQCRHWPWVARVWLFGSRARGDCSERSDIDLAVEAPSADARQWSAVTTWCDERAPTLLRIDVVRWERAAAGLRDKVARQGVLLHERGGDDDGERVRDLDEPVQGVGSIE